MKKEEQKEQPVEEAGTAENVNVANFILTVIALIALIVLSGVSVIVLDQSKQIEKLELQNMSWEIATDTFTATERPTPTVNIPLKIETVYACYWSPCKIQHSNKQLTQPEALQMIIDYLGLKYVETSTTPARLSK